MQQTMETITCVYHNTSLANRATIVQSAHLNSGTHFGCTLFMGQLPTQSPHGSQRIAIPIQDIMELFATPRLFLREIPPPIRNMTAYNLVLTDGNNLAFPECPITNNEYLILDKQNGIFLVKSNYEDGLTWNWVNLRIDKDIPLIPHQWTTM